jgi:hypothetical protein
VLYPDVMSGHPESPHRIYRIRAVGFDLCFKEQIQKLALKFFIGECNFFDLMQRW